MESQKVLVTVTEIRLDALGECGGDCAADVTEMVFMMIVQMIVLVHTTIVEYVMEIIRHVQVVWIQRHVTTILLLH